MSPQLRKVLRMLNGHWGFFTIAGVCGLAMLSMVLCGVEPAAAVVVTSVLVIVVSLITDLLAWMGKPPAGREVCIRCNNEYVPTNNYPFCPACRVKLEFK